MLKGFNASTRIPPCTKRTACAWRILQGGVCVGCVGVERAHDDAAGDQEEPERDVRTHSATMHMDMAIWDAAVR
jgi:hypothetical protein